MTATDHGRFEVDWGKLVTIVMVLVGTTVLGLAHVIDSGATIAIYSAAAGYVFGNGRLAAKGGTPRPMIGRARPDRPAPRDDVPAPGPSSSTSSGAVP